MKGRERSQPSQWVTGAIILYLDMRISLPGGDHILITANPVLVTASYFRLPHFVPLLLYSTLRKQLELEYHGECGTDMMLRQAYHISNTWVITLFVYPRILNISTKHRQVFKALCKSPLWDSLVNYEIYIDGGHCAYGKIGNIWLIYLPRYLTGYIICP